MPGLVHFLHLLCVLLASGLLIFHLVSPLDDGLAILPPMGWMAWERFRCIIDCKKYPTECIGEQLFRNMADEMVRGGYRDAGYTIISIDDCWAEFERDKNQRLLPDRLRFPSGLKNLSDYIHARGLKVGFYTGYGSKTCMKYPGSAGFFDTDINTFIEWGMDYLKLDGCFAPPDEMDEGYSEFSKRLSAASKAPGGRPVTLSCSWPFYQLAIGMQPNYAKIAEYCHLWRNFDDMEDSWDSVVRTIDYYTMNRFNFMEVHGPGHWNDPDQLIIGNFGLSHDQEKVQMAMWAMFASPLFMSVDLRTIRPESKAILLNKYLIAINQDPLGKPAKRTLVDKRQGAHVYLKENFNGAYAFSVANFGVDGHPKTFLLSLHKIGIRSSSLTANKEYKIIDAFAQRELGSAFIDDELEIRVNPSGVVVVICQPI